MNQIEDGLKSAVSRAVTAAFDIDFSGDQVVIEIPRDKSLRRLCLRYGDAADQDASSQSARDRRGADEAFSTWQGAGVRSYEIAGPGFINFTMNRESADDGHRQGPADGQRLWDKRQRRADEGQCGICIRQSDRKPASRSCPRSGMGRQRDPADEGRAVMM